MDPELETLHVRPTFPWNEYETVDAAINAAKQDNVKHKLIPADKVVAGRIIDSVSYTDTRVTLHLANSDCVQVEATQFGAEWSINDPTPTSNPCLPASLPRLQLQYEQDPTPHVWERALLLRRRVKHKLMSIAVMQHDVILYVEACPPLLFGVLTATNANQESLLLSWEDAE